jgi:hypothetical protein
MKARTFKQQNAVYAENQGQYESLPAYLDGGVATFSFKLSEEEVQQVIETGTIWLTTLTFNKPLQPISGSVLKPFQDYGAENVLYIAGGRYKARPDWQKIISREEAVGKPSTLSGDFDLFVEFDLIHLKKSSLSKLERDWVESTFLKAFIKL